MAHIIKKQTSPYSANQMFQLVSEFENYPKFLPFCSRVHSKRISDTEVQGTLYIDKGPFKKSFTTHNTTVDSENGKKILIKLVNGPFKKLDGEWSFIEKSNGCEVILELSYEMKNGLLAGVMSGVFEIIAQTMVNSFCSEAKREFEDKKN